MILANPVHSTSAHKQLRKLATGGAVATAETTAGQSSTECTICLSSIAVSYLSRPPILPQLETDNRQPCQALFIAPCSHTWHYKCIRPIIQTEYPAFLCPNCRAVADLEEDIEEIEQWEQDSADEDNVPESASAGAAAGGHEADATAPSEVAMDENTLPRGSHPPQQEDNNDLSTTNNDLDDSAAHALAYSTANLTIDDRPSSFASTNPIAIPSRSFHPTTAASEDVHSDMEDLGLHPVRTSVADDDGGDVLMQLPSIRGASQAHDLEQGPLTPRNTAGPFVFDGSAS